MTEIIETKDYSYFYRLLRENWPLAVSERDDIGIHRYYVDHDQLIAAWYGKTSGYVVKRGK